MEICFTNKTNKQKKLYKEYLFNQGLNFGASLWVMLLVLLIPTGFALIIGEIPSNIQYSM